MSPACQCKTRAGILETDRIQAIPPIITLQLRPAPSPPSLSFMVSPMGMPLGSSRDFIKTVNACKDLTEQRE